jgi:integrase
MSDDISKPKTRRKRAPRGGGTVFRRPGAPFWTIAFMHGKKRREGSSKCERQADALELLDKCRAAIRAGTFTSIEAIRDGVPYAEPVTVPTVATVAAEWLRRYAAVVRDEKGRALAEARINAYLVPFLGSIEAAKLTRDDLMDYRLRLAGAKQMRRAKDGTLKETKRGLTVQTQRHILSDARAIVLWARDRGIVSVGVPKKFLPHPEESRPRGLSPEEAAAVAALEGEYGLACRVMLGTGVRWGELVRLDSSCVQRDGTLSVFAPKTGKVRNVPIPPALLVELRSHVGKIASFEPKDVSWVNRAIRDRSGVSGFSAHRCRHTFAYRWLEAGGNLGALQVALGHSTITVTMRYASPSEELLRRESARIYGTGM